ncbi:hypothetical protein [Roseicella frigidaeris]|uniref:Uncharacterized protein n=1 Tax=Roseicella frigidaeris TaxID=2230885 RepID=A0A327LT63_9PROT|nr:hypothetical protein [Roseicella frigidaeris]RAI54070.1 hypothetical protein DOO78_26605 [Roseicella frigidaeris]
MSGELGAVPLPLPAFAQAAVAKDAPMPAPPSTSEISARSPARIEVVLPCGTVLWLDEGQWHCA